MALVLVVLVLVLVLVLAQLPGVAALLGRDGTHLPPSPRWM